MEQPTANATQPPPTRAELEALAHELGFDAFGVAPVEADLRQHYFYRWLDDGRHGDMHWMAREPERRAHPARVLPEARSILVFGLNYYQPEPARRGRIAKYALGEDYHKLMLKRLKRICTRLRAAGAVNRPYVDTGPLLERPIAALAGLGWQGKNTILLNPQQGQWMFLGCILTSLDLAPDTPARDRCGTCTRCIDACPTGAITAPYQIDARRCISYLTIEHHGPIPAEFRTAIGNHLYGCDDCLDVCPWNRWAQHTREAKFRARDYPDLRDMLALDDDAFAALFAGSPIKRIGRARWLRNVCVVLGNTGNRADLPALHALLARESNPLIREHAQWAIAAIERRM